MADEPHPPTRVLLAAALVWLAVCTGALAAALLGLLSSERLRSHVEVENACAALVIAQAFFLVFLWPLFESRRSLSRVRGALPNSTSDGAQARCLPRARGALPGLLVRLLGLLVLALPLLLIARRTSGVGTGTLLAAEALVFAFGVIGGAAVRLPGAATWYYPAAFLLSAVAPLIAYLLYEGARVPTAWAAAVSPLWAAGSVASGGNPLAPLVVYGTVAAAAVGALVTSRRG